MHHLLIHGLPGAVSVNEIDSPVCCGPVLGTPKQQFSLPICPHRYHLNMGVNGHTLADHGLSKCRHARPYGKMERDRSRSPVYNPERGPGVLLGTRKPWTDRGALAIAETLIGLQAAWCHVGSSERERGPGFLEPMRNFGEGFTVCHSI